MVSDESLVIRIIAGSTGAYESLFKRYYNAVLTFVSRIIRDTYAAEDISQNIFMKIWLMRDKLAVDKPIRHLLFVMAKNESLNFLKAKYSKLIVLSDKLPEIDVRECDTDLILDMKETDLIIRGIINNMPPKRREIFVMSRYRNLSVKEIAKLLSLSPRTVEKHISLALQELRDNQIFIFLVLYCVFSSSRLL